MVVGARVLGAKVLMCIGEVWSRNVKIYISSNPLAEAAECLTRAEPTSKRMLKILL